MKAKRKPAHGGNRERAAGMETADNVFPCVQSITGDDKRQGRILDCLPVGADSPVTAKQLTELCGVQNERQITKRIEILRRAGVPVCASTNAERPGYYRAASPSELALYLHGLRGRMKEITHTYKALERVLCEWEGQGRIEGW